MVCFRNGSFFENLEVFFLYFDVREKFDICFEMFLKWVKLFVVIRRLFDELYDDNF